MRAAKKGPPDILSSYGLTQTEKKAILKRPHQPRLIYIYENL
jgi:hypothetical protein